MNYLILSIFLFSNYILCSSDLIKTIFESLEGKPLKEKFKVYHFLFKRNYELNSEEGVRRYKIFKTNLKTIYNKNLQNLPYRLGITQFTDITYEEYRKYVSVSSNLKNSKTNLASETLKHPNQTNNEEKIIFVNEPKQISKQDWSIYLLPPRDQIQCKSSYAFAVTSAIEAQISFFDSDLKREYLSTQFLIDCDFGNNKCENGNAIQTLDFATRGLEYESRYSFSGKTSIQIQNQCIQKDTNRIKISGFTYCDNSNHTDKARRCSPRVWTKMLDRGAFITHIDISSEVFQHYSSGYIILNNEDCLFFNQASHWVTVVGLFQIPEHKKQYVKIRNSFGISWGENGYFNIIYEPESPHENCGISHIALLPQL
jgi:hypothetical protein